MPAHHAAAGLILRCRDGHWEWGDFELRALAPGRGFGMVAACQYGDHWLRPVAPPEPEGALTVTCAPYTWPSAHEAFAALDRYKRQEKEAYR